MRLYSKKGYHSTKQIGLKKFDTVTGKDKAFTGEGFQVHGWGLYVQVDKQLNVKRYKPEDEVIYNTIPNTHIVKVGTDEYVGMEKDEEDDFQTDMEEREGYLDIPWYKNGKKLDWDSVERYVLNHIGYHDLQYSLEMIQSDIECAMSGTGPVYENHVESIKNDSAPDWSDGLIVDGVWYSAYADLNGEGDIVVSKDTLDWIESQGKIPGDYELNDPALPQLDPALHDFVEDAYHTINSHMYDADEPVLSNDDVYQYLTPESQSFYNSHDVDFTIKPNNADEKIKAYQQRITDFFVKAYQLLENWISDGVEVNDEEGLEEVTKKKGSQYEVEIPDDWIFLEEKKINDTLNEDDEKFHDTLSSVYIDIADVFYPDVDTEKFHEEWLSLTGEELYHKIADLFGGRQNIASNYLYKHGIAGIHYYGDTDGECWVVFHPADLTILNEE